MKKFLAICAVALLAVSFTSCKKDYVCECKVDGVVDNTLDIPKSKKADAETACSLYEVEGEVCTLN